MQNIQLFHGDCLEVMNEIPDGSVDMICADLPYGTTNCKWDAIIPFELLWKEYNRISKSDAAMVFTASMPFTGALWASNPINFRYSLSWIKTKASNFQHARRMPMKRHEDVLVFYRKQPIFNLETTPLDNPIKSSRKNKGANLHGSRIKDSGDYMQKETGFKFSDIYFPNPSGAGHLHPTQKPVALLEYLIKTYTNEGDTVLDNVMGSGTTGVACMNLGRKFIGIEKEEKYFEIAKNRIFQNLRPIQTLAVDSANHTTYEDPFIFTPALDGVQPGRL